MPIITSTETTSVQADGSIQVHEVHTDQNGNVYDEFQTFPAGTTAAELALTMSIRATNLGAQIDMLARAEAAAHNFTIPKTQLQFLRLFTVTEYAAIKTAAAANPTLDFYWQKLMATQAVYMNDPEMVSGVKMLETAGLIAVGRAAIILAS